MDKTKINILIGLAVIILLIIFAAAKTHNKKPVIQTPPERAPFEQIEERDQMQYDPNDPNLPQPPIGVQDEQSPNALDVMAPGYKKAQERAKKVQELRKQALEAQKQDLENNRNR